MNITAVLTTHGEGELIVPTLESFNQAVKHAETQGFSVEKIITLDNPSDETIKVVKNQNLTGIKVLELKYGDMGKVRNHAAGEANGEYLACLDGDDLWSFNWLVEAFELSEKNKENIIVHPEFNWYFGENNNIFYHSDETYPSFDYEGLRSTNPWDSLCFCKTKLVMDVPYLKREISKGFAYEDWSWNRRTLEKGIKHIVAKDTIIFKRRRGGSSGSEAAKRGVIAKPTKSAYYDYK